ncbi:Major facilitator superfamily domain-containing protein 1 [Smittium mucronatum]|uniref:Lysosomal dipeptide transporter MFSD1 n=1 Tax=Smittium mucronatum TaxID=133383 RepID=A0A1R0H7Z2_9FUNG|nr:Major facilitator superfamily domain-containing protein 1 [Smittium mucronatum]
MDLSNEQKYSTDSYCERSPLSPNKALSPSLNDRSCSSRNSDHGSIDSIPQNPPISHSQYSAENENPNYFPVGYVNRNLLSAATDPHQSSSGNQPNDNEIPHPEYEDPRELGISNSQYGVLQSTVSLVNTIIPVFGGFFIDSFGTSLGSLLATFFIMFGSLIIALSTNMSSFPLMVLGRILYGLGSGTIVTVQETILGHWFKGSSLAATIALQISTARLSSYLSMGTAVPIMNWFGFYGAAFWASSIICVISFVINFMYYREMSGISKSVDSQMLQKLISKNDFNMSYLTRFSGLFWLIILTSFVLGSSWNSFLHMNSEFIKIKFGVSDGVAAWNASFSQLLPIFLVPLTGVLIDRYGLRTKFIVVSSGFFLVSILVLGYTSITPILGMLIFSLSLTLGPVSLISSATLVLSSSVLGTGLGLYKSALNVGSTLIDIWIGFLQDSSPKDSPLSEDIHLLSRQVTFLFAP